MVSWKCARMKTIATVMLLSLALGAFGCGNEQKAEKAKVDVGYCAVSRTQCFRSS